MRLVAALLLLLVIPITAQRYDPMLLDRAARPTPVDLMVRDAKRSRDIPVRVYLPSRSAPASLLLFSHGLGGSRENSAYLGEHWAGRGYVVVAMQHIGSDESVWKGLRPLQVLAAMRKAASAENLFLRFDDVSAVLDQLTAWNNLRNHPLAGRLNLARIGMSGHSFGAVTTQGVTGQWIPTRGTRHRDARLSAAVIFSPSPPRGGDAKQAFGSITTPWLLMTGTEDDSPIGDTDPADRLKVYPALPPGSKYELVLDGAKHSAFGDVPGRRTGQRNPNHHRAILALSTAFWDAYLREDVAARAWLHGAGARAALEKGDRWRTK